ncbi:MAG: O-antigen ligase family protein [Phycisphaerales bacterium]
MGKCLEYGSANRPSGFVDQRGEGGSGYVVGIGMAWTRQTPGEIERLFSAQRAADPFGVRLHLFFGCAYVFLAAWPTTWVDWAGLCLLVCFAVRMLTHHRILGPLWWDPVARLTMALVVWATLSGLWSKGNWQGWAADAGSMRYAAAIALLFPVMDRRGVLLACLLAGFACGELSQLAHALSVWSGRPLMLFNRDPARLSGWWDPVVGGSRLCGALGVSLGLALARESPGGIGERGWGRLRVAARVMVVTTAAAIVATGTRGAWIGAAGLLVVAACAAGWRWRARLGEGAGARLVVAGLAAVALAAAAVALSPGLRARVEAGHREVAGVLEKREYRTDTGMRLAMWGWAGRAVAESPIVGVGAGGYRPFAEGYAARKPDAAALPMPHAHAHSWYLHTLATLGVVGAGLMLAMVVTGVVRAHPAVWLGVAGLALAGLFDTMHVNQQTANLLFILLAMGARMGPGPVSRKR